MTSKERHEARYQRRKARREARRKAIVGRYDSYDRAISVSALIGANWASRKGVLWKGSVARYNAKYFKNARQAHRLLSAGKDTRQGFYHFSIVERGKLRDIHSLHYAERVIRRSICTNVLVPILSHSLIYDNGASLENKGITFAIDRCAAMLHKYWRKNRDNEGYVLVIDFKSYFNNIEHDPLFVIYDRYIQDRRLNAHCKLYVTATGSRGLFIGPEDSQISGITYPSKIDHKIKDVWRCKYYGRYMDDSYIIMRSKDDLLHLRDVLFSEYEKQGIVLNKKKTQVIKLSRGFTFLKTQFILQANGRVLQKPCRASTIRERRKLKSFKRFVAQKLLDVPQVSNSYMSWRGYMERKDAHRTIIRMDKLMYQLFAVKPWIKTKKKKKKWKGALNDERIRRYGTYVSGKRNPGVQACPF